jgi:hypothetical protein
MDQIAVAGGVIDTHLEIEIFIVTFREHIGETAARPNEPRLIHFSNSEIEGNRHITRLDPTTQTLFGVPDQGPIVVIAADGAMYFVKGGSFESMKRNRACTAL